MSEKTHVIIHGHFYQPPRENPWTGAIDRQESAQPYHDWNERVWAECYRPNARSRVLDGSGRVLDVVNNYEYLSFNFGPTLLSWMEEAQPDTYARILEADRHSLERLGHGNAMAQVYNHVIMPLASPRDRLTQIRWGQADFEHRFGRRPEGMWLAETACNQAVVDDLIREGIQFIILAPSQAELIRGPGEAAWRDVSAGDIPVHRPYRCRGAGGELAVFFYHDGVSQAVAFEHVLRNASFFADRIQGAAEAAKLEPDEQTRLCMVATDGESYGHHEAMGDMCLAYLASRELPGRGLAVTNPAAYLEQVPASWEVRLKAGGEGLGTAWSCAHGTGRWREDCGCTTGGPPSWNQAWRKPLRGAFDELRQRIDPLFEQIGNRHLKNPWAARDDYIGLILGRQVGGSKRFFETHQKQALDDAARAEVFRLMEMQRHGMLMYTSCGWFFADLAGIEAVQNLAYFARAAQLGELLAGHPVSADAIASLHEAESNLPAEGDGVRILDRRVRPHMLAPNKVAAHQAIVALVEGRAVSDRLYGYRVQAHAEERGSRAGVDAFAGRLTIRAHRTAEAGTFDVVVVAGSGLQLEAFVRPYEAGADEVNLETVFSLIAGRGLEAACTALAGRFDVRLGLTDMLPGLRWRAMGLRIRPVLAEMGDTFDELFQRHEGLLRSLAPLGVGLPEALAPIVAYAASRRYYRLLERELPDDDGPADFSSAAELGALARSLSLPMDLGRASRLAGRHLAERLERIIEHPRKAAMDALRDTLDAFREMELDPPEAPLQDRLAEAFDDLLAGLLDPDRAGGPDGDRAAALIALAGHLNLNVEAARARLEETRS